MSEPTWKAMARLRLVLVLGLLALALTAAGCGGGTATQEASGEVISFEQLSAAARSSADATSGRFAFSLDMTIPDMPEPFSFAGEGAFDANANRAQFSFDFGSFAQLLGGFLGGLAGPNATGNLPDFDDPDAWKIEAVQDGDVVYMRFPAITPTLPAGKSWVRVHADKAQGAQGFDFTQFQDFTSNDPRDMLELLRAASGGIENVGTEELRGVPTTHYRATVDLAEYEKLVPAEQREEVRSMVGDMLKETGLAELPVDVWLDENDLVRKVVMSFSATDPSTSQKADGSVTIEMWDYGKALGIEVPPADQVVDESAID